jgi:hypothetical protein
MPHWKDHLDSSLLGAYSLYDDATDGWKEVDGLIIKTCHEDHVLGNQGKKNIHVAYTSLGKPMRLNHKISDAIALIAKCRNPEKWVNVPVTFYVDSNVKLSGVTVDAIRVKPQKKSAQAPNYDAYEAKLRACKSLDELAALWTSPGFPQLQLSTLKDQIKNELSKH